MVYWLVSCGISAKFSWRRRTVCSRGTTCQRWNWTRSIWWLFRSAERNRCVFSIRPNWQVSRSTQNALGWNWSESMAWRPNNCQRTL